MQQAKFIPFIAMSLAALAFLGGRCVPPPPELVDQPTVEQPEAQGDAASQPADVSGVVFVKYENKAMGYVIDRPDKWYWRHYLKSQIQEQVPDVDDYFISDPAPLGGLGSEYLGRIVIEASRLDLSEYADEVAGFASREATVAGEPATRYAGERDGSAVIEYQFSHGDYTYRLRYQAPVGVDQAAVFERVASSLKFGL